jgi:MFS family permease
MTGVGPKNRAGRRRGGLLPDLPRPAWVVLGGDFLSAIGSGLTLPCLFLYTHQVRGLSSAAAGLVVSTIALASLLGNPLGGALADRCTPRRALLAGLGFAAAGSVALAVAHSAITLFGAAGLLGVGVAIIWPAQDAFLAGLVRPVQRPAVFSVRHASLNAGLGLGALAAAAVIDVAQPATFVAVYLADAATFVAVIPFIARLPGGPGPARPTVSPVLRSRCSYRTVLADKTFRRVWALTALVVGVSFGQYQTSFVGYATRPGGITPRAVSLAFAANTLTVVGAQLFVLRRLGGHRRTSAVALAGLAWAATWATVILAGHLGAGAGARLAFASAMIVFAVGETLLSPTLPAIINDLAPPEAVGRYNGLGAVAFTTGFLVGPASGALALGSGWGTAWFVVLVPVCLAAAAAALRLRRHLPVGVDHIPPLASRPTATAQKSAPRLGRKQPSHTTGFPTADHATPNPAW